MPKFPPSPDEVMRRLFRVIRPPTPPKFFPRGEEEEGLPKRRRREIVSTGSKMVWPWRIVWKESSTGRGQIKVIREDKGRTVGTTSFESRAERMRVVTLLEGILKGEG